MQYNTVLYFIFPLAIIICSSRQWSQQQCGLTQCNAAGCVIPHNAGWISPANSRNNSTKTIRNKKITIIAFLLLANSLEYPERIQRGLEWTQLLKRLCVLCSFLVSKFSHFSLFQPSLFIQYSTEEYSTVQVFIWCLDTIA